MILEYCTAQEKKIEDPIWEVDTTMRRIPFTNLLKTVFSCKANEGGHFEHLLGFKLFFC